MKNNSLRLITENLILALVYFLTAQIGMLFALPPGNITAIWLPSGIVLAAVLIRGIHLLPGIFIGAFIGNAWAYFDASSTEMIFNSLFAGTANGLGDVAFAYIGFWASKEAIKNGTLFRNQKEFVKFLLLAVVLGSGVSALFGISSLALAGFLEWDNYLFSLLTWWTGDSVGVLLLTPIIFLFYAERRKKITFNSESFAFISTLVVFSLLLLEYLPIHYDLNLSLFILSPILIWGALRLDKRIGHFGILMITSFAIFATVSGFGEFSGKAIEIALIELQIFLATLAITIYVVTILTDASKHAKELKIAKEKAVESERLKSAFLANMSHEIRTPMNGILGFAELLQDTNLSLENQRDYIDIITNSGERLLSTVNDIVEISKIDSGQIVVKKSDVDILDHINTQVKFFKPEAEKKGLNITMHNSINKTTLNILSDKVKLHSISTNLIKNAIKYTNEGAIEVGITLKDDKILLSCKDSGIGISESRQEAIFNRFEMDDIENKAVHEGSGLGLAIVKSYVEMLEGEIWLKSKKGEGSTFYVSLPYEPVQETGTDSKQTASFVS